MKISIDLLLNNVDVAFPPLKSMGFSCARIFHPEHKRLLQISNGLYVFDKGVHLFGMGSEFPLWHDLIRWNAHEAWKHEYRFDMSECYFAETALGDQFYYNNTGEIGRLEAETGHKSLVAESFVGWLSALSGSLDEIADVDILLDWQNASEKKLQPGYHLCPRIPFCLGGSIDSEQDGYLCNAIDNMRFKGQLASQLCDVKPGEKIDLATLHVPSNVFKL